ncbi:MAG: (2Fe-2S)-binding protein [Deltaproteobacteria bacterium]|nr:(2Fe-2S)-binding protein [Deltaproteobacteria bacterium]
MEIHVKVNDKPVTWNVSPGEKLLDVLRRDGYLSVKFGCGEGDCGACTVLVDGRAMRACLLLAGQVEGRAITTVEALGTPDAPHPLQTAFVECGAVQCGYCTPGMLLAAYALLRENPKPSEEDVREALDGNLCRCTGYKKIIEAVLLAAERMGRS